VLQGTVCSMTPLALHPVLGAQEKSSGDIVFAVHACLEGDTHARRRAGAGKEVIDVGRPQMRCIPDQTISPGGGIMEIAQARYLEPPYPPRRAGAVPHSTKCVGAHTFPSDRSMLEMLY
jgi:hypothetical protein